MALEKMKSEFPYPVTIKIEENQKDFIDLDTANSSPKDIVLEWHLEIRKFFARHVHDIGEAKLMNLMNYYIRSLQDRAINFEDTNTLRDMMDKHMEHIFWLYTDLDICYPDSYLDHMEHILTFYVNLSFRLLLSLKTKKKITRAIVHQMADSAIKRMTHYLLGSEYHIFHVMIRQSSNLVEDMVRDVINIHNSNICKQMFRNIYMHYLLNRRVKDVSDEAFCRGFILFENWKAFDDYKQNEKVEWLIAKQFGRDSGCIKNNAFLKQILEPQLSPLKQLMKLVGCDASITKAYFDHIKSKQKESADNLEDIDEMAQDLSSSSDIDWDDDDEDAQYRELYEEIVGTTHNHMAVVPNSQHPVVKEEKIPLENLSIDDEVHVINSDSDSESVKLVSIIPSQKNRTTKIRTKRMNHTVGNDKVTHSFLDSIPLDTDSSRRKKSVDSSSNCNKTTIDGNQNEAFNPSKSLAIENRDVPIENNATVDAQLDSSMQNLTVDEKNSSTKSPMDSRINECEKSASNIEKEQLANIPTEEVQDIADAANVEIVCNSLQKNQTEDSSSTKNGAIRHSPMIRNNTEISQPDVPNNSGRIVFTLKTSSMFRRSISNTNKTESQEGSDLFDSFCRCDSPLAENVQELRSREPTEIVASKIDERKDVNAEKQIETTSGDLMDTANSEILDDNSPSKIIRIDYRKTEVENEFLPTIPIIQGSNAKKIPEKNGICGYTANSAIVSINLQQINESHVPSIEDREIGATEMTHSEFDEPIDCGNNLDKRLSSIDDDTQNDIEIEISTNEHLCRENIFRKKRGDQSEECDFLDTGQPVGLHDTGQTQNPPDLNDSNDEMVLDQTSAQNPIITTDQHVQGSKSQLSKNVQRVISPPGYLTPPGSDKEVDKNVEEFTSCVYTNIGSEYPNESDLSYTEQGESSSIVNATQLHNIDNLRSNNTSLAEKYEQIVQDAVGDQNSTEDEFDQVDIVVDGIEASVVESESGLSLDKMESFLEKNARECPTSLSYNKRKNGGNDEYRGDTNSPKRMKPNNQQTRFETLETYDNCDVIKKETDPGNKTRRSERTIVTQLIDNSPTSVYNNSTKNGLNRHTPPLSNNNKTVPKRGILKNSKTSNRPQHSFDDEIGYSDAGGLKKVTISDQSTIELITDESDASFVPINYLEDKKIGSNASFVTLVRLTPKTLKMWEQITERTRAVKEEAISENSIKQVVYIKKNLNPNEDMVVSHHPPKADQGRGSNLENNSKTGTVNEHLGIVSNESPNNTLDISYNIPSDTSNITSNQMESNSDMDMDSGINIIMEWGDNRDSHYLRNKLPEDKMEDTKSIVSDPAADTASVEVDQTLEPQKLDVLCDDSFDEGFCQESKTTIVALSDKSPKVDTEWPDSPDWSQSSRSAIPNPPSSIHLQSSRTNNDAYFSRSAGSKNVESEFVYHDFLCQKYGAGVETLAASQNNSSTDPEEFSDAVHYNVYLFRDQASSDHLKSSPINYTYVLESEIDETLSERKESPFGLEHLEVSSSNQPRTLLGQCSENTLWPFTDDPFQTAVTGNWEGNTVLPLPYTSHQEFNPQLYDNPYYNPPVSTPSNEFDQKNSLKVAVELSPHLRQVIHDKKSYPNSSFVSSTQEDQTTTVSSQSPMNLPLIHTLTDQPSSNYSLIVPKGRFSICAPSPVTQMQYENTAILDESVKSSRRKTKKHNSKSGCEFSSKRSKPKKESKKSIAPFNPQPESSTQMASFYTPIPVESVKSSQPKGKKHKSKSGCESSVKSSKPKKPSKQPIVPFHPQLQPPTRVASFSTGQSVSNFPSDTPTKIGTTHKSTSGGTRRRNRANFQSDTLTDSASNFERPKSTTGGRPPSKIVHSNTPTADYQDSIQSQPSIKSVSNQNVQPTPVPTNYDFDTDTKKQEVFNSNSANLPLKKRKFDILKEDITTKLSITSAKNAGTTSTSTSSTCPFAITNSPSVSTTCPFAITTSLSVSTTSEESYPNRKMISIAELPPLRTAAMRKEIPPDYRHSTGDSSFLSESPIPTYLYTSNPYSQ